MNVSDVRYKQERYLEKGGRGERGEGRGERGEGRGERGEGGEVLACLRSHHHLTHVCHPHLPLSSPLSPLSPFIYLPHSSSNLPSHSHNILLCSIYFTIVHYISLYFTIFHYPSLSFTLFHYTSLYFTIFHYLSLYFTIFHYLSLSFTTLFLVTSIYL